MRDERKRRRLGVDVYCDFDQFAYKVVGRDLLRPQTYWLVNWSGEMGLDYIGHYETLHDDFEKIISHLRIGSVPLPYCLNQNKVDYRQYYNTATAEHVRREYVHEIALFGYTFDGEVKAASLS